MTKLWVVFAALSFTGMFLIYEPEGVIKIPLMSDPEILKYYPDKMIPERAFWYFIYEHTFIIAISWVAFKNEREFKWVYFVLIWLCVIDAVFFCLFYKSPNVYLFPWNGWKILIFGICVVTQQIKNGFDTN